MDAPPSRRRAGSPSACTSHASDASCCTPAAPSAGTPAADRAAPKRDKLTPAGSADGRAAKELDDEGADDGLDDENPGHETAAADEADEIEANDEYDEDDEDDDEDDDEYDDEDDEDDDEDDDEAHEKGRVVNRRKVKGAAAKGAADKPPAPPTVKESAARVFHHLYVIALIAAVPVLLLAPFHLASTVSIPIDETLADGRVRFEAAPGRVLEKGDVLPVYRFNKGWKSSIGEVKVRSVDPNGQVWAQGRSGTFRWRMGLQGLVTEIDRRAQQVTVNAGAELGLTAGHEMVFFGPGIKALKGEVVSVEPRSARVSFKGPVPPVGTHATIFMIPNTINYCASDTLIWIERIAFVLTLLVLVWRFRHPPSWNRLVAGFGSLLRRIAVPRALWLVLLSVPVLYLIAKFLLSTWNHFAWNWGGGGQGLGATLAIPAEQLAVPAFIVLTIVFLAIWLTTRRNPWSFLRERLGYRPLSMERAPWRWLGRLGVPREAIVWALHLVVVAAFAHTLFGFLRANTASLISVAWPDVTANFDSLGSTARTLSALLSTPPTWYRVDITVRAFNLILYNITITGAMWGYAYGVITFPFKRDCVKNVDFTFVGWLLNAICYGALLGAPLWNMLPSITGERPGIADGPLCTVMLFGGLLLNLLYTITVLNLWSRFGVMVDKGIENRLAYSVVRHPSYTLEGVMFALIMLPAASSLTTFAGLGIFVFLYWIRSERDDDFMTASNPDYQEYKKAVPYKFLPGLV